MCYGWNNSFQHDHRTCPVHKAETEAYKKAHRSTKRASPKVCETTVEEELSKMRTELAKEIQEIKRSWTPKQDKDKDKDKGKGRLEKERRRQRGRRGGWNPDHKRRPLAEPLQPRAPARAVAG